MILKSYSFKNLLPVTTTVLEHGVYIVVLHTDMNIPHLALLVEGKMFTLTMKGAKVDGDLNSLQKLITKGKIETVFVRLKVPQIFTTENLVELIRQCTLKYPKVSIQGATCLTPIRDFCVDVFDPQFSGANFIYELLPKLEQGNYIDQCYVANQRRGALGKELIVGNYELEDIYHIITERDLVSV